MASFQDLNTIASDSAFRGRCLYALLAASVNVMAESGSTTNHAGRVAYASQVINGSVNTYQLALTILSNSTIAAEATTASLPGATSTVPDADLQFTVNSLFNSLAGIPAA